MHGSRMSGQSRKLSRKELAGKLEVARQFRKAPRPNRGTVPAVINQADAITHRQGKPDLIERPMPPEERDRLYEALGATVAAGETVVSWSARYFTYGELTVLLTREFGRLHLSVSHPQRMPTWGEVSEIFYNHIRENDETVVLVLPKPENFVNLHQFCFHVFGIRDGELPDVFD